MAADVHGYLLKNTLHEQLYWAIRAVYCGGKSLSPNLIGKMTLAMERLERAQSHWELGLSKQELKVLRMMADGATNREIAEWAFLSNMTVQRAVRSIIKKLGVANRAQAIIEAIRRGWI
jgi:DNA-binding NarL/FixJ family response regulator